MSTTGLTSAQLESCSLLSARRVIPTGIQQRGNFFARPRRGEFERLVDVNIALGDAPGGVAEERGNRQLGKAQVAGDAAKGVAKRVGRDPFDLCGHA